MDFQKLELFSGSPGRWNVFYRKLQVSAIFIIVSKIVVIQNYLCKFARIRYISVLPFHRPDIFSGPLSELDICLRRQKMLYSVADQLKNKECKTVIGILITAKSRILKKWKVVDARLAFYGIMPYSTIQAFWKESFYQISSSTAL